MRYKPVRIETFIQCLLPVSALCLVPTSWNVLQRLTTPLIILSHISNDCFIETDSCKSHREALSLATYSVKFGRIRLFAVNLSVCLSLTISTTIRLRDLLFILPKPVKIASFSDFCLMSPTFGILPDIHLPNRTNENINSILSIKSPLSAFFYVITNIKRN